MTNMTDLPLLEQRDEFEDLLREVHTHLIHQQFPDRLLSVKEACHMLSVSRSTLNKMMKDGEIAYVDQHGPRIPLSAILAYIKAHTVPANAGD